MDSKKSQADKILERDILEILESTDISEEEKIIVYRKMLETIKFRTIDRVLNMLSDEDVSEWRKLLDEGDEVKINQFLSNKGINTQELMLEETMRYKLEISALVEHLKKTGKSIGDYYQSINKAEEEKKNA